MRTGCGHGDQFQVYTRKKGLVWSKVQGSKQVVLGENFYSIPTLLTFFLFPTGVREQDFYWAPFH